MKKIFITLIFIIWRFELLAQQNNIETVYFDYDKYSLTPQAAIILDKILIKIKSEDFRKITLLGHTDADGVDNYNIALSQSRAKIVSDYFQAKGISKDKITIQFYGDNKPIEKNETEQDKKKNRRVEIIWDKRDELKYENFEKQSQLFSIPAYKDTTITCIEGTIIKFKANCFVSERKNVKINDRINISVKEYYKISDILLANLTTISDGQLLETAGMINIVATSNYDTLQLGKGDSIEISFPTNKKEKNMQLFSGSWNNNHINWTPQRLTDAVSVTRIDTADEASTVLVLNAHVQAKFKGGDKKLREFLSKNLTYPSESQKWGVQGLVLVSFIINATGEVKNPKVLTGVTPELDSAAVDVIRKMPNWIPAKKEGIYISSSSIIRVVFKLEDAPLSSVKDVFNKSYNDTTLQKVNSSNLLYYVLSSSTLGWINCDKFLNISPKIDYVVQVHKDIDAVKIIFNRYKSIMQAILKDGVYMFKGVPNGEKITILAIKRVDGKLFLALKQTETSTKVENQLDFQPITMESLKTEMKKLDKLN